MKPTPMPTGELFCHSQFVIRHRCAGVQGSGQNSVCKQCCDEDANDWESDRPDLQLLASLLWSKIADANDGVVVSIRHASRQFCSPILRPAEVLVLEVVSLSLHILQLVGLSGPRSRALAICS